MEVLECRQRIDETSMEFPLAAVFNGDTILVQKWRSRGGILDCMLLNEELSPLQFAAARGDLTAVNALISCGAYVDYQNESTFLPNVTALHISCRYGNLAIAECLLQKGSDPNKCDKFGFTGLHYAVYGNCWEIIDLLLSYDAKVQVTSTLHKITPIDIAVSHRNEHIASKLRSWHARELDPSAPIFKAWLESIGASEYLDNFTKAGYDVNFINEHGLDEEDLNCIGIPKEKRGTRKKLILKVGLSNFLSKESESEEDEDGGGEEGEEEEEEEES